jgi:hypothetical protein
MGPTRPTGRGLIAGTVLVVAALVLSACGSGTPATSDATSPHTVSGVAQLLGISCSSESSCEAVGATAPNGQGVVVSVSNGHPGSPRVVEGTKALVAVSCTTGTSCQAVGVGGGHGVSVVIDDGRPAPAQSVAKTSTLQAISCPGAQCQSVGSSSGVGAFNSVSSAVLAVPGTTSLNGVDCWAAAACQAIASTSNGKFNDVVVPLDGNNAGPLGVVPPGTSTFSGIACHGSASCLVVGRGTQRVGGRLNEVPVVVPVRSGKPGTVVHVRGPRGTSLASVSCPSSTLCEVVGSTGQLGPSGASGHGVVMEVANGRPGSVRSVAGQELTLDGISCPTVHQCWAVGTNAKDTALVLSIPVSG